MGAVGSGSPVSREALRVVPVSTKLEPVTSWALAKLSLAGMEPMASMVNPVALLAPLLATAI